MLVQRYAPSLEGTWNEFVGRSKNSTFLFHRSYVDYHADRFEDCSLVVRGEREDVVALLPANRQGEVLMSHAGLTYGGFISTAAMTANCMLDVFGACLDHVRAAGMTRLVYKCVPHFYHSIPAEEDLYALFRHDAVLTRRDVSSAIDTRAATPFDRRRLRALRSAGRAGVRVEETTDFARFWPLLEANLRRRHGRSPVHTLDEIERLARRFPDAIKLFCAVVEEVTLAGVVAYLSANVCHIQYNAVSEEGRSCGAQDLAMAAVVERCSTTHRWIDFGISTEHEGRRLNEGLVAYKEGFGARTVTYDTYEVAV